MFICTTCLFDHQQQAVDKLIHVKVGALYMEQGTGKTRTALELISKRLSAGKIDKIIWLTPCSIKENLKREIQKHIGYFPTEIDITGIETLSTSIRENSRLLRTASTYRCYLIVDESILVKNPYALRTQHITNIADLCRFKLILNGTPISKTYADLFAQWYILDWRILGYKSYWSFAANHIEYDKDMPGRIRRCLNVEYLTRKIAPYAYQVKKKDCLSLPEKIYKTWYYDISRDQRSLYDWVSEYFFMQIEEMEPHTIYRFLTALQLVLAGFIVEDKRHHIVKTPLFQDPFDNPRIDALISIIKQISDDEKVIIYTAFTQEVDDILCVLKNLYGDESAVRFDGSVPQKARNTNALKFADNCRFFVTNSKCSRFGLNLQFCSNVIYYSNTYEYVTRAQSEDRVHRIGQIRNVMIYDICASVTIDERILDCLVNKENLIDKFKEELKKNNDKRDLLDWLTLKRSNSKSCVNAQDRSDLKDV